MNYRKKEPHHLAACSKELSVSSFLAQVLYKSKSTGSKGESRTLANAIASLKNKKRVNEYWQHALVITPPDVSSTLLVNFPTLLKKTR